MVTTIQDKLRDLIGKGKTQQALDALSEQLFGTDEGNNVTLLKSRWNSNQRSFNMGMLSNGDYNMEANRINYALLSVIGDLEENSGNESIIKQVQEVIHKIEISGTGNIVNIGGVVNTGSTNTTNINDNSVVNSITGGVHVGDNVKGDKFGGDKVMGDKISGDKIVNKGINKNQDTPSVQKKKIILFIAANPQGKNETNSGKESQNISNAINNGTLRENYELQSNFASNVDELLRLLKKFKPSIVHLSMHGAKNKGMLFEDASGNVNYVSEDVLASFFELANIREKVVECVVLSACNSDSHAEAVNQYVDYTVGMQGPIPPVVAIEYTSSFYESILEGDDYEIAHKSAKALLRHFAKSLEWNGEIAITEMPKLYEPRQNS